MTLHNLVPASLEAIDRHRMVPISTVHGGNISNTRLTMKTPVHHPTITPNYDHQSFVVKPKQNKTVLMFIQVLLYLNIRILRDGLTLDTMRKISHHSD